jgi:hypothetical protein
MALKNNHYYNFLHSISKKGKEGKNIVEFKAMSKQSKGKCVIHS